MTEWLDLHRMARAVARRWWWIVCATFGFAAIGYLGSGLLTPVYRAQTSLLVGGVTTEIGVTDSVLDASDRLALTYADVIRRRPVMQGVLMTLGLQGSWRGLVRQVHVQVLPENPRLIEVSVESTSAEEAVAIAKQINVEMLALSPTASDPRTSEFVGSMLTGLELDIAQGERQVARLTVRLQSAGGPREAASLRDQIRVQRELILGLQGTYARLLESVNQPPSANRLDVLERPSAPVRPIRPDRELNTALATFLGGLLSTAVVIGLGFWVDGGTGVAGRSSHPNGSAYPPQTSRQVSISLPGRGRRRGGRRIGSGAG